MDIRATLSDGKEAFSQLTQLTADERKQALKVWSQLLVTHAQTLLVENNKDLDQQKGQISDVLFQRLSLSEAKIKGLAEGVNDLIELPDPLDHLWFERELKPGLSLKKISTPIGLIAIVFESRPDVIPQILSLALKSGNAVVLKGGREAIHSNRAFMSLVAELHQACPFLPKAWAQLIVTREDFHEILKHDDLVDLVIPRGSSELVQAIMEASKVPVLGHTEGICHQFVHSSCDQDQAIEIIRNSKEQYPSACNALETLLVEKNVAQEFLPNLIRQCPNIKWKGCQQSQAVVTGITPATDKDWSTEYGDLQLAIKIVDSLADAIAHINKFGSHHTDGILAKDAAAIAQFTRQIDSADVFVNASTRYADGFRFGLGAEVGISTSKIHARGPVGIEGLLTYKYILMGDGHIV